jgi:2-methylisocitrate lyase-like PEP mutase family enzyme
MDSPGKRLRALLNQGEIVITPGIFDGFSARMAESAGFPAAIISGAGVSESSLGVPDVGLMGYEENLRVTRALAACTSLPLIADVDTGYGNAVNVFHTVQGFEQAGVAGAMIEDQVWPKRCGHMEGKEVIPAEEHVEKIHAAVEARRDPDFVIKARTDALATHGLDETIRRLQLYCEAGADLLIADAVRSKEDIATIVANVPKPFCVNMGIGVRSRPTTPLIPAGELEAIGVAMVAYPRLLSTAAVRGMQNAIAALNEANRQGVTVDRPELALTFQELMELMGLPAMRALEQRFLTESQLAAKYGPATAGKAGPAAASAKAARKQAK